MVYGTFVHNIPCVDFISGLLVMTWPPKNRRALTTAQSVDRPSARQGEEETRGGFPPRRALYIQINQVPYLRHRKGQRKRTSI
jgi:hypothetical protein